MKVLSLTLRSIVTVGLLGYVVTNVNLENLWLELQGIHLGWYLLGLGISVFSIAINAFKWRLLLLYLGYQRSYRYLFTLQLYGILFNNILPTSIGGDAVRAYCASQGDATTDPVRPADVIASIFVQRLTGLVALVLLAIISFIISASAEIVENNEVKAKSKKVIQKDQVITDLNFILNSCL